MGVGVMGLVGMGGGGLLFLILFFKRFYLFIFRERGREGEREEEKYQCVVASCVQGPGSKPRHMS